MQVNNLTQCWAQTKGSVSGGCYYFFSSVCVIWILLSFTDIECLLCAELHTVCQGRGE